MTKLKKMFRTLPLWALILVAAGSAAGAMTVARNHVVVKEAGRPEVKVTLAGTIERGGKLLTLDKVGAVNPGEILQWNIATVNEGDGSAHGYKSVSRVPEGTVFIAGSAHGESGAAVTYSIDKGQTFVSLPLIEEKQPDGSTKQVPAPVSMYTEVRYEWNVALAAGGKLSASYKVRVK